MSRRILRAVAAAYLLCSLVFGAAALAAYLLGQAILQSMVTLIGAIVIPGAP